MFGRIERAWRDSLTGCGAATPATRGAVRRRRSVTRDPHALAVVLDLDFSQAGFIQELGELKDQRVIDQRGFWRFGLNLFLRMIFSKTGSSQRLFCVLAPTKPATPVIASA